MFLINFSYKTWKSDKKWPKKGVLCGGGQKPKKLKTPFSQKEGELVGNFREKWKTLFLGFFGGLKFEYLFETHKNTVFLVIFGVFWRFLGEFWRFSQ